MVHYHLKLRHTPQIIFQVDDSIKKGIYMDNLIKQVSSKNSEETMHKDEEYDK